MRIGLALPHYDTSYQGEPAAWDRILTAARTAEESGFDSVWVSDHFFLDWGKYGGPDDRQGAFECWTLLSAIAARTKTVRLGSLALCNDFRNPALLAKMAASLDLLSGGRLELGLGAGWYEPEYQAAGIDFDEAGARIARLGEAGQIVRRLLDGEELTFEGRHYTIDGAVCRPVRDGGRPLVWFGGKGDYLIKTAVRHADGWNFSWLGSLDTYRDRLASAEKACAEEGRDLATLHRSVGAYVMAGRDEADAARRFERLAERTPPGVLRGPNGAPAVSWDEFKAANVAGSVNEVIDRLGAIKDLGVEEVVMTLGTLPFQLGDLEDVELVGQEIAPAVR
ncbi:MAG: LLM class flavin-dependent oxidoreductase [Actinomycetota bacterium]